MASLQSHVGKRETFCSKLVALKDREVLVSDAIHHHHKSRKP